MTLEMDVKNEEDLKSTINNYNIKEIARNNLNDLNNNWFPKCYIEDCHFGIVSTNSLSYKNDFTIYNGVTNQEKLPVWEFSETPDNVVDLNEKYKQLNKLLSDIKILRDEQKMSPKVIEQPENSKIIKKMINFYLKEKIYENQKVKTYYVTKVIKKLEFDEPIYRTICDKIEDKTKKTWFSSEKIRKIVNTEVTRFDKLNWNIFLFILTQFKALLCKECDVNKKKGNSKYIDKRLIIKVTSNVIDLNKEFMTLKKDEM